MQANKTHISLETAKLLKDCWSWIDSDLVYYDPKDCPGSPISCDLFYKLYDEHKSMGIYGIEQQERMKEICYPAYTRQEILREYAEEFFGDKYVYFDLDKNYTVKAYKKRSYEIIQLLQQKKYQEADLYFRENCVLIK